jgi:Na+:H+ antiporter, NhaA family
MRWTPKVARPPRPIRERFLRPIADFARAEASSGGLLMVCAIVALVWANSPWAAHYTALWQTQLTLGFGDARSEMSLLHWVNDGLMALFFLYVGLEIKREILIGELSSKRRAALPIFAALGGMIVPALIYAALNAGRPGARGWGVPMATDIAFALGVLALLGNRVPFALKVFLAAVAIVDDLGAVLVIATFYTSQIATSPLLVALAIVVVLLVLNSWGVRSPIAYLLLGVGLWVCFLQSGIHATIAGVVLALTIPAKVHLDPVAFDTQAKEALAQFDKAGEGGERELMNEDRQSAVRELERACERVQMPLERIEDVLQPWVAFVIMPVFALANAGVSLAGGFQSVGSEIGLGVLLGLVLGKPLGITLFSVLAVKAGVAQLPSRIGWRQMLGAGILGGIGFTMSLFIAELAFKDPTDLVTAKLSILAASVTAGALGYLFLSGMGRRLRPAVKVAAQQEPL